jgi:pyrroloquinoline quinone biosynthesis protein D
MSERALLTEQSVPKLARHAKLRFDQARSQWIINAPERVFELDETAAEVLQRLDGERSLGDVAEALAAEFDAPRDDILSDVLEMLQPLLDKGMLRL